MSQKKNFVLRLSPDMYTELEKWAAQEFRSVNGQIEFILHQAVSTRKKVKSEKPVGEKREEN
jgi:hypothetical protein